MAGYQMRSPDGREAWFRPAPFMPHPFHWYSSHVALCQLPVGCYDYWKAKKRANTQLTCLSFTLVSTAHCNPTPCLECLPGHLREPRRSTKCFWCSTVMSLAQTQTQCFQNGLPVRRGASQTCQWPSHNLAREAISALGRPCVRVAQHQRKDLR